MTTDTELRDLLAAEAGGPTGGSGGWEDVVRRGRRRQQTRRAQRVALAAAVVAVAVAAITLSTDDALVETTPPAGQPAPTTPAEIDPSTVLQDHGARIPAARSQGDSVTLFFWDVPNLCDLRPLVAESADRITVGLVDEHDERGVAWVECGDALDGDVGAIELRGPVGDRPLVDLSTGRTVPVTDSADLLFPTTLPAPFDVGVFVEGNGLTSRMSPTRDGSTFRFTADNFQYVHLSSSRDLAVNGSGCDGGQTVEVRGTEGCFTIDDGTYVADGQEQQIEFPPGSVHGSLSWNENGRALFLAMLIVGVGDSALEELLAIAEDLEPMPA